MIQLSSIIIIKNTLAGRVCNYHRSILLAFLHIDVTIGHQIADVEKAAIRSPRQVPFAAVVIVVCLALKQQLASSPGPSQLFSVAYSGVPEAYKIL